MSDLKKRVLVVEDHPIAQKIAQIILLDLGHDVDVAESGSRALALFKENEYSLVFVDLGLPDISGYTLVSKIREIENKAHPLPIIGLSAHANDGSRSQAIQSGMNDYIVKPLTFENCQDVLNRFLKPIDCT